MRSIRRAKAWSFAGSRGGLLKDRLASDVLAKVMGWGAGEVAAAAPKLQMLASHKYDSYEGYRPGVKFLENLSAWLASFPDLDSSRLALRFVLDQLVFVSRAELDHLIETVYPDTIRPMIMRETASLLGVSPFAVAQIAESPQFQERQRKLLVLGLSDGARIDRLRRSSPGLSHEQIYLATDLGDETMSDALTSLRSRLGDETARFEHVLLVDDFYGSGATLLREQPGASPPFKGRLLRTQRVLDEWSGAGILVQDYRVSILIYIASSTAVQHVTTMLARAGMNWTLLPVLTLSESLKVDEPELAALCEWHYDDVLVDRHKPKRAPLGFGDAALPVVLYHNTPNNSVCLLWADTTDREESILKRRALFPRYERHREDRA